VHSYERLFVSDVVFERIINSRKKCLSFVMETLQSLCLRLILGLPEFCLPLVLLLLNSLCSVFVSRKPLE